ncbi:MAG: aldehyde:ferredoxin oxidoreductase [SAR202 cluster bacterium Io17-Chloro-G9]|nr:MAG: aldehyde:ferredoxin oxidoreductase [SAR202 cluster bacterium Io17-Chloro-G9]
MYGYHGKALLVDLTTRSHRWKPIDQKALQDYIGGVGLGTYLLYEYCPAGADPLGPDNPLIFAGSPLVGSRLTTSSKFAVVTKSPLTGFIGDSLSSSFLATELKRSCGDALVIRGQAAAPTLLYIEDGEPQYLDAADLMGLSTSETEQAVKERLSSTVAGQVRVASIGPAGENLVSYASIANDGGRQAGRTGPGAVMGSKNLKAIALRGSQPLEFAEPKAIRSYAIDLSRRSLGPNTEKYRELGTMANVSVFNRLGALPTRNFKESTFEGADDVSGERLHQEHLSKNANCANCTIGCEKILSTSDGGKKTSGRMEYESLFALGPLCGVSDPNTVIRAGSLCDEMGLDTISAGVTIAWAMECFEKGLLTIRDTAGIDLTFGNGDALLATLEAIGNNRGIGALLAKGTRRASEEVGRGSQAWAMQVKGLEMPGYEPRSLKTMTLGLAVTPRGACHNRSSAYEADFSGRVDRLNIDGERGAIAADSEDFSAVLDSLIWCKFLRKAFDGFYEESALVYTMITGWEMSPERLVQSGERINNLKKLFNIREGWTRSDDTLPNRVLQEKLPSGVAAGVGLTKDELDQMISDYYQARGWTGDGLIPEGKLAELGMLALLAGNPVAPAES